MSQQSGVTSASARSLQSHEHAIKWIMDHNNFIPQQKSQEQIATPFIKKHRQTKRVPNPGNDEPISSKVPPPSITNCDLRLIHYSSHVLSEVDNELFQKKFLGFYHTRTRLEHINTGDSRLTRTFFRTEDQFHDNLVHLHGLLDVIQREVLIISQHINVERLRLKLIAIVTICFGCTSEPAFFLTTMDRMLQKLMRDLSGCAPISPNQTTVVLMSL